MKKVIVVVLALCLIVTLFTVTPAMAGRFWPGVAVGVGSAILLGHMFHHSRPYYYDYRPAPVYTPPAYYSPPAYYYPPPPVYRDRWMPGYWVENYGPYGNYERYWMSGHWERY